MPTDYITKRPHKKSRAGCVTCKKRKVKCDEAHPTCTYCATRNLTCTYLKTSSVPSSPSKCMELSRVSPYSYGEKDVPMSDYAPNVISIIPWGLLPGNLSLIDMRLMHHYTTNTWSSLTVREMEDTTQALQCVVPQLAFEHEFLMNAVLALAALHVQQLTPGCAENEQLTLMYKTQALKGFREAIADDNFDRSSFDAALVSGLVLVVLCASDKVPLDGNLVIFQWVALYRGVSQLLMLDKMKVFDESSVKAVFQQEYSELEKPPVVPKLLLAMLASITPADADFEYFEHYCAALDQLGTLYSSLVGDGLGPNFYIRTLAWATRLSPEFGRCCEERRPRALVILAFYLCFLKLVQGVWWIEGIADREITLIVSMAGPQWVNLMQIPIQISKMTDIQAITELLLS